MRHSWKISRFSGRRTDPGPLAMKGHSAPGSEALLFQDWYTSREIWKNSRIDLFPKTYNSFGPVKSITIY